MDQGEQHVLLTRRGVEPFKGQWDTPGGFLEPGESLEDGLRRELKEELGVEVRIVRFLGSYPDVYGPDATPVIAVFYVATVDQGSPVPGSDVSECKWFHKDDVPAVAFEDGRRALEEWRRETERCGEDHWRTRDG